MTFGKRVRLAALAAAAVAVTALGGCKVNAEAVSDLTTAGSSATIGGAIFETNTVQPTGSGVIHSFVRISTNDDIVQGYNTDARPLQFDENNSGTFTRSQAVADLQVVNKGGVDYYAFLLDINQQGSDPLLNLNDLEIYLGDAPDLLSLTPGSGFGIHSTLVYDIDALADSGLLLGYNLNSGSGSGDIWAFIPKAKFTGPNPWVYLYSSFGVPNNNNDGYEEWAAVVGHNTPSVPVPASVWGGLTLLGLLGAAKIRSRRQSA
jgi:hypothetical protein